MAARDFRVDASFLRHPKTVAIRESLGPGGPLAVIGLWAWATEFCPSGQLPPRMGARELARATGFEGDPDALLEALLHAPPECESGFLDGDLGALQVHAWDERNPFVVTSPERAKQGREAAEIRWSRERERKAKNADRNADRMRTASGASCDPQCGQHADRNARIGSDRYGTVRDGSLRRAPARRAREDRTEHVRTPEKTVDPAPAHSRRGVTGPGPEPNPARPTTTTYPPDPTEDDRANPESPWYRGQRPGESDTDARRRRAKASQNLAEDRREFRDAEERARQLAALREHTRPPSEDELQAMAEGLEALRSVREGSETDQVAGEAEPIEPAPPDPELVRAAAVRKRHLERVEKPAAPKPDFVPAADVALPSSLRAQLREIARGDL